MIAPNESASPTPNRGRRFARGRGLARAAVDVIAPSKARRLLPGESPGRVRASHPLVSSVGPAAELCAPRTNSCRTRRIGYTRANLTAGTKQLNRETGHCDGPLDKLVQPRNRMRENRGSGTMAGAPGNRSPYAGGAQKPSNSQRKHGSTVEFAWNAKQAAVNLRKHGVDFDEAATVFGDSLPGTFPDHDHSAGKQRFITVGRSSSGRLQGTTHGAAIGP